MSTTEVYEFKAPQFVESLATVEEMEDGADKFFDAADNVKKSCEDINSVADKTEELKPEVQETGSSAIIEVPKASEKENIPAKKLGRPSRVARMSVKPNSPLRRSARFTSLAEQVHNFHHATPPRFKRTSAAFKTKGSKFLPTVAHSPRLQTKIRARQSVAPCVAEEERPVFKPIKVPKTQPKPPPKPAPRPTTVPKPFNLTESGKFKKKTDNTQAGSSHVEPSPRKPVNVKKAELEVEDGKVVVKENWAITGLKTIENRNKRTKVMPFSFQKRNEDYIKAKQAKVEKAKENGPDTFKSPARKSRPATAK